MSAIYRGGKLGDSLVDALDILVTEGKIDGELAQKVLETVRCFTSSEKELILIGRVQRRVAHAVGETDA
jgi:hypothetical protein